MAVAGFSGSGVIEAVVAEEEATGAVVDMFRAERFEGPTEESNGFLARHSYDKKMA